MAHDGLAVCSWGMRAGGRAGLTAAMPPARAVLHPGTSRSSSCEGLCYGVASVAFGITTTARSCTLEEPIVGMSRWQSCLEHAAHPAPLHTGLGGVCGEGGRVEGLLCRWLVSGEGRVISGARHPAALATGGLDDVDPGSAALPVLEAGEASEVLSRGRGDVGASAWCEPPLGPVTRVLGQAAAAREPDVTPAL